MLISPNKSHYKKSKESLGWWTKKGDMYMLCPFHKEKTPSCVIHARTPKYFHCYGCGKSGDLKYLDKQYQNVKITFENKIPKIYELDNPELPW